MIRFTLIGIVVLILFVPYLAFSLAASRIARRGLTEREIVLRVSRDLRPHRRGQPDANADEN
jgi:hypothetical protein